MNSKLTGIGIVFMIIGALFTFFTFGFGIVCTWPFILISFIIFIVGVVVPKKEIKIIQPEENEIEKKQYCAQIVGDKYLSILMYTHIVLKSLNEVKI